MAAKVKGRDAEIAKLVSRVKKSQDTLLYGMEGIGKTAVVEEVMKRLPKSTLPVYFSFSDLNVFTGDELLLELGKSVLKSFDLGLGNVDDLYEMSIVDIDVHLRGSKLSPAVKEKLKFVLTNHKQKIRAYNSALTALINLMDLLASELSVKCLLVLEDLHLISGIKEGLDSVGIRKVMGLFPSFSHTTFLFTSEKNLEWSVLKGFERVELKALDQKGWHHGIPRYMALGKEAKPVLELYFSERLKRLSNKERQILFAMVKARVNTPAEISKKIEYSQTSIRRFLTIMEEKGFVKLKKRGYFELNDPVFEEWLESS